MKEWINNWMNVWINEMNGWIKKMNEGIIEYEYMNVWISLTTVRMNEWMNEWLNEWMNEWIYKGTEWMNK